MGIEYKRISKNCRLFIDCYWDKKENVYVRSRGYNSPIFDFGVVSKAPFDGNIRINPLCGFAISPEEKENIKFQLEQCAGKNKFKKMKALLNKFHSLYGRWEKNNNPLLLKIWAENKNEDKSKWAKYFLIELNKINYSEVMNELNRLKQNETEDRVVLGVDNFQREHLSEPLISRHNEPAYLRESERVSLRIIKDDFENWFYAHDTDPLKIYIKMSSTVQSQVGEENEIISNEVVESPNEFEKIGDVWKVRFNGGTINHIKELKGMNYIASLLGKPRIDFSLADLRPLAPEAITISEATENNLRTATDYVNSKPDKKTLTAAKKRLEELEEKRIIADNEGRVEAAEEMDEEIIKLNKYISISKRGKPQLSIEADRDRKRITIAIQRAIKHIDKYDKELSIYLENNIETGINLRYKGELNWQV